MTLFFYFHSFPRSHLQYTYECTLPLETSFRKFFLLYVLCYWVFFKICTTGYTGEIRVTGLFEMAPSHGIPRTVFHSSTRCQHCQKHSLLLVVLVQTINFNNYPIYHLIRITPVYHTIVKLLYRHIS